MMVPINLHVGWRFFNLYFPTLMYFKIRHLCLAALLVMFPCLSVFLPACLSLLTKYFTK